jgi:hypothetical protein
MATRKNPKSPDAPQRADDAPDGSAKAQAEFQRYKQRMAAGAPGSGAAPQGVYMVPVAMPPGGTGMPGWAVPPSLASLSPGGAGAFGPTLAQEAVADGRSLIHQLGSTLRLGVDVVNAALANGARMLNGAYGLAGGYGEPQWDAGACGCASCCDEGCGSDCGCSDCCGGYSSGCSPHVGRCC